MASSNKNHCFFNANIMYPSTDLTNGEFMRSMMHHRLLQDHYESLEKNKVKRATPEQKRQFYTQKSRRQLTGAAREILRNAGSPIQNENTEIFSPKTGIFSPKNRTPYYQQSHTPDPGKIWERFEGQHCALRLEGA